MKNNKENDLRILRDLYNGNHLNNDDLERALTLIKLMEISIKERVK